MRAVAQEIKLLDHGVTDKFYLLKINCLNLR